MLSYGQIHFARANALAGYKTKSLDDIAGVNTVIETLYQTMLISRHTRLLPSSLTYGTRSTSTSTNARSLVSRKRTWKSIPKVKASLSQPHTALILIISGSLYGVLTLLPRYRPIRRLVSTPDQSLALSSGLWDDRKTTPWRASKEFVTGE